MPNIQSLRLLQLVEGQTSGSTRFYLPSTGAAAASTAFDGAWEETGAASRLAMVTTKINSAMVNASATTLLSVGDEVLCQYVSASLDAQTITGDVKIYARASETLATVNAFSRIVLKVVSNDGGTDRGTLLAFGDYSTGAEWNTSLRNKSFADIDPPSSVTTQSGDRLVLEIGFNHAAVISAAQISVGDDSASDLPEDETTTTADNPWLEIGQTITFASGAAAAVSVSGYLEAMGIMR